MFKKAIPLVLMSGLVLGGCYNTGTVPKKNETPMEKVQDRTRNWAPVNQRGGTNLDGIDHTRDLNGNGVRNGVINGTGPNGNVAPNGVINGPGTSGTVGPNGVINGGTLPREEIIIEENTTVPNGTMNRNRNIIR